MKITPDIIDLVKSSIDIVDVVSDYFPLKRSGRNYKALCPFHQEKTPSFMVNADRQIFRCFGCGAGGDVIEFVMKQEGYSFMEALRALAERGRVSLPETTPENASRRERLLRLHETAAGFYHWVLTKSDRGRAGRTGSDLRVA
ncbi:MAG TPA: CHC2 zinc finger domain-containing protein [bacterium]|nr:CHC2 zinc finger domain-containing protein [bacterium]